LKLIHGMYPISISGMFIAYLWGIKTLGKKKRKNLFQKFIAYLWGIETFYVW